ncbi:hypothetical protein [Streptomyces profundus]|uniref:hypothetical protein n=1 Tax=Streptomyces profundus TaxID=2867410 RepID=UPI001D166971|nr:hypothetical protein [Streptomyces sp. MA3_2.13]UED87178.1 hypothetical protein K4G22_25675 [Streptomyces sp. MA3_2.13]
MYQPIARFLSRRASDSSDAGEPQVEDGAEPEPEADPHAELRARLRARNAASESNYRVKSGDVP